jgi:putative transposase
MEGQNLACNSSKSVCSKSICCSVPQKPITPCVANLCQVSYTTTCSVTCKYCGSENVVKYGKKGNTQYYLCRDCKHTFAGNDALPGMRFPPEQIAAAVSMFYDGLSIDAIRRQLNSQYQIYPSDSTVYDWVIRFTKAAVEKAQNINLHVGGIWVADETVLKLDRGIQVWFWDIEDSKTRFLLASHMSVSRGTNDARQLMMKAYQRAKRSPRVIITDKLAAYLDGIELVFGADTKHIQTRGFTVEPNTNLIERFHGTLKARTKVMRGMQNRETAKLIMDGWLVHYNFFRPHESLGDRTPASVANASFPYHTWKAVVIGDNVKGQGCVSI